MINSGEESKLYVISILSRGSDDWKTIANRFLRHLSLEKKIDNHDRGQDTNDLGGENWPRR